MVYFEAAEASSDWLWLLPFMPRIEVGEGGVGGP